MASDLTDAVFAVSLSTGNRTIVADDATGTGAQLNGMTGIAYHGQSDRIYVWNRTSPSNLEILAIVPSTVDRTTVSSDTVGSGPEFGGRGGLVLASDSFQVIASDRTHRIFSVSRFTGARMPVLEDTLGSGPSLQDRYVSGVACGADGTGTYAASDGNPAALLHVDLTTATRTFVSGGGAGSGGPAEGLRNPTLDGGGTQLAGSWNDVIYRIDVGSGELLWGGSSLVFDPGGQRLFYVSDYHHTPSVEILEIDGVTGDHDRQAGFGDAEGPWPRRPIEIAYDAEHRRLFVADWQLRNVILIDVPPNGLPGDRVIVAR